LTDQLRVSRSPALTEMLLGAMQLGSKRMSASAEVTPGPPGVTGVSITGTEYEPPALAVPRPLVLTLNAAVGAVPSPTTWTVALTSALNVGYLALCVWFRLAVSSTSEVLESTSESPRRPP
jgi:hypothetical protein